MVGYPGSGPQYEATDTVDPTVKKIKAIPTQMEVILTTIPLLLSEKLIKFIYFVVLQNDSIICDYYSQ